MYNIALHKNILLSICKNQKIYNSSALRHTFTSCKLRYLLENN